MKLFTTFRIKGGAGITDAVHCRLDGTARRAGWRRVLHSSPQALLFETPPRPGRSAIRVGVWRDPSTRELVIGASDEEGQRLSRLSPLHGLALGAFLREVIVPIAELVPGGVLSYDVAAAGIEDLVPEELAAALNGFVKAEEELRDRGAIAPVCSDRLAPVAALVHVHRAALDGATLAQWLAEDLDWPEGVAGWFGDELDQGLAFLREHDPAKEGP